MTRRRYPGRIGRNAGVPARRPIPPSPARMVTADPIAPPDAGPGLGLDSRGVSILAGRLDRAADALGLDFLDVSVLQQIVCPEQFRDRPAVEPTPNPPGHHGKITELGRRFHRRVNLFHPADAPPLPPLAARHYVLVVQLRSQDRTDAIREARTKLGLPERYTKDRRTNSGWNLPEGASVELG